MDVIFWAGLGPRTMGVYQLAHWVRKHGYEAQVIDFVPHLNFEQPIQYTEKFISNETICIGVSSTFWSIKVDHLHYRANQAPENVAAAIKKIRKRYPNIKFREAEKQFLSKYVAKLNAL